MGTFIPCQGKTACRDDGTRCLICGRSLEEIEQLRSLIDGLTSLAVDYDYENIDEFSAYVTRKLGKKISYRRETT